MKFSVIVPVYNTQEYLKRCIESVLNQTYKNYEIILINDGSTDNSLKILKKYESNNKVKIITQKNHGLSYTRNVGILHATGDYVILLDSDDFLEKDLFKVLNLNIKNEDMIKFNYNYYFGNNEKKPIQSVKFKENNGREALIKLINEKKVFEMSCIYAYKKDYIKNFEFEEGKYHEDLGLIPLMIFEAKTISSIDYIGYNYDQTNQNSITAKNSAQKEYKKALDVIYFFNKVTKTYTDKYLLSFYANAVINKYKKLDKFYKKEYKNLINNHNVINCLLNNTIMRKIKKIVLNFYFKV